MSDLHCALQWTHGPRQWDPQSQDDPGHMNSLSPHVLTAASKDARNPGWSQPWDHLYGQSSHTEPSHPSLTSDPYAEALGAGLLSAESHSTSEPNLGNAGSNILADDIACVELSSDDLALRGDFRIAVILRALARGTRHWRLHPKVVELWIRMIEGNDLTDDVWLWMDGDEEWLREYLGPNFLEDQLPKIEIPKGDWVDAQSALRRRINQSRHPRSIPRSERIRNATPEQRLAAIYWLTLNSNHIKDLAIELGHSPPGMFELCHMVLDINRQMCRSWDAFPEDSAAWEKAAAKLGEDGCTCLENKWMERCVRCWFNMLSWLDGKPPTMEVIGFYCTRCKSWAKSRYDRYRLNVQGTHPKIPLWDVLCLHAIWYDKDDISLAVAKAALLSRLVGPGARQQVEQQLRSRLVISDTQDVTYMPYINDHFPDGLRRCAGWLSRTAGLPLCTEHSTSIDIPHGLLDHSSLSVILGATAWVAACLRSPPLQNGGDGHDEGWHREFHCTLQLWFETFTECALPKLSLKGVAFYTDLAFDCDRSVFGHEKPERNLETFVVVAIFLRKKNVPLHCCRRCQVLFARSFSDTVLSASPGALSLDSDDSELDKSESIPGSSLVHTTTGKRNPLVSEDLVGMEAFTDIMINKNLTQEELQSQLAMKFNLLTLYADSIGLNLSACLPPSCSSSVSSIMDSDSRKCPTKHSNKQLICLSKHDKIEQIKERLLEMLRSSKVFISHGRLPWSTLESDLEKQGLGLVNWPAGVPRKRNRGIYDLSAEHADKLYRAIMHPDEEHRLGLRSLDPAAVDHTAGTTHDANVASSSKRTLDGDGDDNRPPKRIKFKEPMTRTNFSRAQS